MSIISCTSPSASEVIFPASRLTRVARSSLCSVSSSPSRLTSAPRAGAGTVRHWRKAASALVTAAPTAAPSTHASSAMVPPLTGEVTGCSPATACRSTPQRRAVSSASSRSSAVDGMVVRGMVLLLGSGDV